MQLCFIKESFKQYLAQTSPEPPMYQFVKGKGIYLYTADGKEYIDLISGIAVNNIGHRNKKVLKAIKKQLNAYMHQMVYGEYIQAPQIKLAKKLCSVLPPNLNSVYLLSSGSEAIEGAMKLAKKATGRSNIVAMRNAYHGSTAGALSLMDNEYYSSAYKPLLPNIYFASINDTASLDIIDDETAAVFIEPVQAESGYLPLSKEFLIAARKKCDQHKCLLIFDEIQSGMGRTGKMFAFEHSGVLPDVITLAKGLGGGMPISCFISSKEIMDKLADNPILGHISTFGGHPVSAAAAHASLKFIVKKKILETVESKELRIRNNLKHRDIIKISGKGLMLAVHLENYEKVCTVIDFCYKRGLIIDWFLYANNALRIAPPLIITNQEIDKFCSIILEALNE